jgi:hypothetical protein
VLPGQHYGIHRGVAMDVYGALWNDDYHGKLGLNIFQSI